MAYNLADDSIQHEFLLVLIAARKLSLKHAGLLTQTQELFNRSLTIGKKNIKEISALSEEL